MAKSARLLGVDVGGTFTDFVYVEDGRARLAKRPSTPDDPGRAVVDGIRELGWQPDEIVHGSTVATNALLTRTGAPAALIATKGFRDTLVIGRQARPDLYALHPTRPEPLIPARLSFEVPERIAADGQVVEPLDLDALESVLDRIERAGVSTVAICFLFSFVNPAHERLAAQRAEHRGLSVSASHQVLPQHREYERMSTTAANASLAPIMTDYLTALEQRLADHRTADPAPESAAKRKPPPKSPATPRLRIMQSNGGSLGAASAGRNAVRTVLSGPAGGVAGGFYAAREAGFDNAITFDMGGTSTDVALCPGRLLERTDLEIDGIPVRTPAVDVHTVGAGGGSIAWLDPGGALRVGPQSAGADPGPASYGRGRLPAVTDAHVALGRLQPGQILGDAIQLDQDRARQALETIAAPFNRDVLAAARAVIDVVNANMARALRVISVERGRDPARFALVAAGGAGPLHACDLADALQIQTILIPVTAGVLSANGMLQADITRDAEQGLHLRIAPAQRGRIPALADAFRDLAARARDAIAQDGYRADIRIQRSADIRYQGQSHELQVPLPDIRSAGAVRSAFHAAHQERFGFADQDRPVEIVTARAKAVAPGFRDPLRFTASNAPKIDRRRPVEWDRPRRTRILDRASLPGRLAGPAVILQEDATTLVAPGWTARAHRSGHLILGKTK